MTLRIEKSRWGDRSLLAAAAIVGLIFVLRLTGVIDFGFRRGGDLHLGVVMLGVLVAMVPAVVWWRSSAPLVEMDDEHVTFFTGWKRNERCRIPRAKLLLVSVQKDEREARVLSLLFDGAAVQPLRKFTWTPYLEIKSQEVFIPAGYVRGDPEEVADAWNRAIEAVTHQRSEDRGQRTV